MEINTKQLNHVCSIRKLHFLIFFNFIPGNNTQHTLIEKKNKNKLNSIYFFTLRNYFFFVSFFFLLSDKITTNDVVDNLQSNNFTDLFIIQLIQALVDTI